MPSIAEIRASWGPASSILSDEDIVRQVAEYNNADPASVAASIGYVPSTKGVMTDIGNALKQGVEQLPGQVAGLADLPFAMTGLGRPITRAADWGAEVTGFAPGKWARESQQNDMSPEYYRQQQEVQQYWDDPNAGVLEGVKTYFSNPRVTGVNIAQSVPGIAAMGAGGRVLMGVGRAGLGAAAEGMGPVRAGIIERAVGQRAAVPVAGGIAEGVQQTGQQMSDYDVNAPDQARNAFASLGTGMATGLITGGAGRLARGFGFETVETALIGGKPVDLLEGLAKRPMSMVGRIGAGAVVEGGLEEVPQSMIQQVGQNWANRAPLGEGVARAGVEGGIAGTAMGGAFNIATSRSRAAWQRDVDAAQAAVADQELPPDVRRSALDFLQKVRENDIPAAEASNWRAQAALQMDQGLEERQIAIQQELDAQRDAAINEGRAASLLGGAVPAAPTAPTAGPVAPVAALFQPPQQGGQDVAQAAQTQQGQTQGQEAPSGPEAAATAVPAAPVIAAAPTPRLTPDLRRAKPRFNVSTVDFPDDLHLAAYIIGNDVRKSARDAEYLSFVKKSLGIGAREARAYGRQVVAAVRAAAPAAVEGRIAFQPVAFATQGAPDGNAGQVVPPGSGQAPIVQGSPASQAVGQAGEAPHQTAEGTEAVQVRLAAVDAQVKALMASKKVPERDSATPLPASVPLDEEGVTAVAEALQKPTGAYAALFDALKKWDDYTRKATGANSPEKQAEFFAEARKAINGEKGSDEGIIPFLYVMESEFGTDGVDRIIGKIKTDYENKAEVEPSFNVRLAAAWTMYKQGMLASAEGLSASGDNAIRFNYREQQINKGLEKAGVATQPKLKKMLADKPGATLVNISKKEGVSWSGPRSGVMNFLSDSTWQAFSSDYKAMAHMMYRYFKTHQDRIPTIVFDPSNRGTVEASFDSDNKVLTVHPSGHNMRAVLHELRHAITQTRILGAKMAGGKIVGDPAVEALRVTLDRFVTLHKTKYTEFLKFTGVSPESSAYGRLEVAVIHVLNAYDKAKTHRAMLEALAEFDTYGSTNLDFQAYMKWMKLDTLTAPYKAEMYNNGLRADGKPRARSTFKTIWGKYINAMAWITSGRAWSAADANVMNQFLSDSTRLLADEGGDIAPRDSRAKAKLPAEPAGPKRTTAEKVASVKAHVAAAKPAVVKPATVKPVVAKPEVSELRQGDVVTINTRNNASGVVTRSLGKDAYLVSYGPTHEVIRVTREYLTLEKAKGKTLKSEAPAKILTGPEIKAAETPNLESATPEGRNVLFSQAPAFPWAGQTVDPAKLNTLFDPRWARKDSVFAPIFASMGYTGMVERTGEKLAKMTEAFALAFPNAAKWISYIDENFGLPQVLSKKWKQVEAQSHYPKLTANALARLLENIPLEDQQKVLSYLDGAPTVIAPEAKLLADDFMDAFDELMDEYMKHAAMDEDKRDALQTKIYAAKFSDLLIYIADPTKTKGRSMSTAPLVDYLGTKKASVDEVEIKGLDTAMSQRFFAVVEQITSANNEVVPAIAGFVSEDLASNVTLAPGQELDRTVGWFHKGKDAEIPGYHVFTRNMGFKDAKALNAAASHAAAIRNTVDQMDRVVTSARYADATITFGTAAGLVYASRADLESDHPRMKGLPITSIGAATIEDYEMQAKLRRSDQWVSIPSDSKAYGSMAGRIINGSVWAALDDIHHSTPAINIPAYNTMLRWFKKNKTVWSPGTHMVNAGSNVAWMYLHDIPVSSVAEGMRVYYKAKVRPESLTTRERALWTAFQKSGALIADYSSMELRKVLSDAAIAALGEKESSIWGMTQAMTKYEQAKASAMGRFAVKWGTKGKDAALKADEIAQGMYAAEDNVFRLAAFMSKAASLEQESGHSLTPEQLLEAGRAAATEFLDYNIHARGVNLLKQTVLPFISWPYRAVPAMIKIAVYKPWKLGAMLGAYALLDALAVAMSGGDDEDKRKRKKLPAYMNDRMFGFGPHMYLQVPGLGSSDKPVYFKVGAFIPLGDLIQEDNRNGFMGLKWFPSQLTPNGPMVSALIGAVAGVDPFTGQKLSKTTDSQWDAFKKRALFMEGQMVPPALDARRGAERWDRVVNDKTGPLGHEYNKTIELAQWVGLRVYQVDLPESAATQKRAVAAIEMEYRKELAKVTREARRYPNKPPEDLVATKAALKERMKKDIERVKNKGEE